VAKRSEGKISVGGRKVAWRLTDDEGHAVEERVAVLEDGPWRPLPPPDGVPGRLLQVAAVVDGERRERPTNDDIRAHHRRARAELRPLDRMIVAAPPALTADPNQPTRRSEP
jgi:nicotinate phosphoribosyltransferase